MPDDAMDLNDEGVEAAARVLYDRVKSVPTLTYDIAYPSEQDDFRRVASAMLTAYLRAVPESDEMVRRNALLEQVLKEGREYAATVFAQVLAALSPDEAAGRE